MAAESVGRPYQGLGSNFRKLDGRSLKYQYDLERDVAWEKLGEPGDYCPPGLLRKYGLEPDVLRREPVAHEMFQWAYALATCEHFKLLERGVIQFVDSAPYLRELRSVQLLEEEELKHIAMFERLVMRLRAKHPEWQAAYDRQFSEVEQRLMREPAPSSKVGPAPSHYVKWMMIVFFEEVTVHLYKELIREEEFVQPCWLSAHARHYQEEIQHLATDQAAVESLVMTEAEKAHWSQLFISGLPDLALGVVEPARKMIAEAFPNLAFDPKVPFTKTGLYRDVCTAPVFHRSRELCPALQAVCARYGA